MKALVHDHEGTIMRFMPLLLTACLLASMGCGVNITGLDTEVLTVSVATAGANLDADGYLLSITGEPDEPIGVNESKTFTVLRIDVTVELRDIATNCAANANPQTVNVSGPTTVIFLVQCT